jgi:malonyl-CoA/methylmalonyl-CoA synthetase
MTHNLQLTDCWQAYPTVWSPCKHDLDERRLGAEMILLDLFGRRRHEHPDAVAIAAPGSKLAYGELSAAVDRTAAALAARGVAPGDRVALVAGNRPETAVAVLAVLAAGGVAVPVNTAYTAAEVAPRLADAEPRLVVTGEEHQGMVDEALAVLWERGDEPPARVDLGELAREAARGGAGPRATRPAPEDPALLVYTSGTTGRSKGAVLTHGNLAATVEGLRSAWGWRASDRLLLTLPLFHVHGLVVGLFTALASGARVELRRRFRADEVAGELAAGRATLFFGVPTMYVRLVEALSAMDGVDPREALASVRLFVSGSAPLAPATFHAFRRLTGHAILERYGMSETGMNLSNPLDGDRRPGTVGVPLPGVEARIAGPDNKDVAEGEAGELLVRGPNVFRGYWRDPAKTAAGFLPGDGGCRWFRTGDLARRDPESGYVTLLGRSRELVIRGGLNVYPREIEEVLGAAPGVREAAVVGRPDPEWGEVPVAWVVADSDEADAAAILAHCRERLAGFKIPAEIRFVDELPRNALGKVLKHRLAGG